VNGTTEIMVEAKKLGVEDLKSLMHSIVDLYKVRRSRNEQQALDQYTVGQLVENVEGCRTLPGGAIGKIKKINITRMQVDFGAYRVWNMPPSMVKPAPEGAKMDTDQPFLPRLRRRPRCNQETPPELA